MKSTMLTETNNIKKGVKNSGKEIFTKKKSSLLIFILLFLTGCLQTLTVKNQDLNLDFEQNERGTPKKWDSIGSDGYKIYLDSTHSKSGIYSAVIENTTDSIGFRALSLALPNNYIGKSIRLSGYIKTENVKDGFAGLWMQIDPQVAFDNMASRGITGTTDWKEYEITLPLSPKKAEQIVIGGWLTGKGKMWLDDLQVTIDGKALNDPNLEMWGDRAEQDREFDNGSDVVIPQFEDNQDIENLELLGRVWGFMKYYHPNIAKGEYNWDYELFRVLPAYLNVKNGLERDELLIGWIKKFGNIPICGTCESVTIDAAIKPDLTWLNSVNISQNLKKELQHIYSNRNQGENYYISMMPGVGNPNFKNEKLYDYMPYPDQGFRLLTLYKYWNMIQYFFPYKNLTDHDWNSVLKVYIPIFVNAKDELEYEIAITRLVGEVNDSHAYIMKGNDKLNRLRGNKYARFDVNFIDDKLVVTEYYKPEFLKISKLNIGDIITHINGEPIDSIVDSMRDYYGSSNEVYMRNSISKNLLRSSESLIDINYISSGQHKQTKVQLYHNKDLGMQEWYQEKKNRPTFKLLGDGIGYFSLENVEFSDINDLKNILGDLRGLVIDIRNYPNKFITRELASIFVSQHTEFVKFSKANLRNPGEFNFSTGSIQHRKYNYWDKSRKLFNGKLAILVNENSISQSELTAMALRAVPNSLIVGSTTAGADGDVSEIRLPGGILTRISGIGIYYPDGKDTQRVGIIPDIIVKPTIDGIKSGKDEVLQKAIEILKH